MGVVLYEFLFGVPPFNAATTTKVFENIVMRRVSWEHDEIITPEARDIMEFLLCVEVQDRLGSYGMNQVQKHPWLKGVDWKQPGKAHFIPATTSIEDTDYFDPRGAYIPEKDLMPNDDVEVQGDFGESVYKNLNLLEKENQKILTKLQTDCPAGEEWLERRRDSLPWQTFPSQHQRQPSFTSANSPILGSGAPINFEALIADDNPIASQILITILGECSCHVMSVKNGAEAVRAAMSSQFDFIFCALDIPILDGFAVSKMIQSIPNSNESTPFVAVCHRPLTPDEHFKHLLHTPITKIMVQELLDSL